MTERTEMTDLKKQNYENAYVKRFFNELMAYTETYTKEDALSTLELSSEFGHPDCNELDSRFRNEPREVNDSRTHKCLCGKKICYLCYFYCSKVNKKIIIGCVCVENLWKIEHHNIFQEALFDKCEVCERHQIKRNKYQGDDF
jgi:hypothetical protein